MDIAKKNVVALQKNPFSAPVINKIATNPNKDKIPYLLKSEVSISNELSSIAKRLDFTKHSNFIIFGAGNGDLIEHIYNSMSELSSITVIEKNTAILINLLASKDLSKILAHSRVAFIIGEKEEVIPLINLRVAVQDFYCNVNSNQFITNPYTKSMYEKYVDEVMFHFVTRTKYFVTNVGNDITDVMAGFDYSVENWQNILRGLSLNKFENKYKGVPAIIVSAGPSLDKNIELLKKAYGKSLILSVDATYKKVLDQNIIPDAICSIERYDLTYNAFFKDSEIPKESVFIGPPVVVKKVLDKFEKVIISGRSGELYIKNMMDVINYASVELGISCSHVAFAFAKYIGADPIIFIGQDLAFSKKGETHFGQVSKAASDAAKRQQKTWVIGNDGEQLETTEAFFQFLTWFENEIINTPNTTFINATEGGARIRGTLVSTFSEALEKYCTKDIIPLAQMYEIIYKSKSDSEKNELTDKMTGFLEKLVKESEELLSEIRDEIQNSTLLNENTPRNIKLFTEHRKKMQNILAKRKTIQFITQSINISYNRSVHMFPRELSENDWKKLIFETRRYYQLLQEVIITLKNKFEQYCIQVNENKAEGVKE